MSLHIKNIEQTKRAFMITWSDGSNSEMPFIWLRDNDPFELHPDTGERTFDLTSVSLDIEPENFDVHSDGQSSTLQVTWPNKEDASNYPQSWLYENRPGQTRCDPAAITKAAWTAKQMASLPRFDAHECDSNPQTLLAALQGLKSTGIVLIENLADQHDSGELFGDLIGFKRESNYGVMFEVRSKPDPNNLAYTSLALPLHTDLANQEFIPGNQFLHCIRNDAIGGKSVFADAMTILDEFKQECPDNYELLTKLNVPWHFLDKETDLRQHRPVIGLDRQGQFKSLTFNAHLADIPDFDTETLYQFYAAYQELMNRIRSAKHNIEYELESGEMVIFDNQRVLHGRTAFDPESGSRHLRGYYIEHNEVENRIRMLDKAIQA